MSVRKVFPTVLATQYVRTSLAPSSVCCLRRTGTSARMVRTCVVLTLSAQTSVMDTLVSVGQGSQEMATFAQV